MCDLTVAGGSRTKVSNSDLSFGFVRSGRVPRRGQYKRIVGQLVSDSVKGGIRSIR